MFVNQRVWMFCHTVQQEEFHQSRTGRVCELMLANS